LRSTVNVTSGSTEGADGLNVTADQATCTEPYVGLVAVVEGEESVATVPLLAPEPELVQCATPTTVSPSAQAHEATNASHRSESSRFTSARSRCT
jgi:hypothetical protein